MSFTAETAENPSRATSHAGKTCRHFVDGHSSHFATGPGAGMDASMCVMYRHGTCWACARSVWGTSGWALQPTSVSSKWTLSIWKPGCIWPKPARRYLTAHGFLSLCIRRLCLVSPYLIGTSVTLFLVHPQSARTGQLSLHWLVILCVRGHGPELCACLWHAGGKCGGGGEGIRMRSRARQRQEPSQRTAAHAGTLPHLTVVQKLPERKPALLLFPAARLSFWSFCTSVV